MAKKKNFWYVLVITNEGPKFVTSINYSDKTALWDKLEKPLEMSMERAKDLALGLNLNMFLAFPVCHIMEVESQPYRYDAGHFQWIFDQKGNH